MSDGIVLRSTARVSVPLVVKMPSLAGELICAPSSVTELNFASAPRIDANADRPSTTTLTPGSRASACKSLF